MNLLSIGSIVIGLTLETSPVTAQSAVINYLATGSESDWYNGHQYCLDIEYDSLAAILTDEDYAALRYAKDNASPRRKRIADDVPFWVGLYQQESGEFAWIDGTPCETDDGLCVSDWIERPDINVDVNGTEYCVTLTVNGIDGSRGYEAVSCDTDYPVICSFINETTSTTNPPEQATRHYLSTSVENDWHNGARYCVDIVYDSLASIYTDADYAALRYEKDNALPRRYRIADGVPFWVGLYQQESGKFAWIDGTPCETDDDLCVSDWLEIPDIATDTGEYCVTLTVNGTDGSKGYRAVSCDADYRVICSYINDTSLFTTTADIDELMTTTPPGRSTRNYLPSGSQNDWHNADKYCVEIEFDSLASISTDDDYEALRDAKDNFLPKRYRIADDVPFWVGLYRQELGGFAWIDGTPCEIDNGLCVSDWLEIPDIATNREYCVTLTVNSTDGTRGYEAVSCDTDFPFICSYINDTSLFSSTFYEFTTYESTIYESTTTNPTANPTVNTANSIVTPVATNATGESEDSFSPPSLLLCHFFILCNFFFFLSN